MKIKSTLWLAIAGLFFAQVLSSCNSVDITKRRYNKGFYVDLGGNAKTVKTVTNHENVAAVTPAISHEVNTVASAPTVNDIKEQLNTLSASTKNIIAKKAIRKISREVEALAVATTEDKGAGVSSETASPKDVTATKDAKKSMSGPKSQLVALLLCFFLGGLGIHRFYLGYTWQGVVQLLTLGGCGVWALIDFIRIIIGDLQPKDGKYDKTL